MKVWLLGCGSSGGVPTVGNVWGTCDPENPKNRRRRPSVMVEARGTRVLVDTSPDMREQLLDAGIGGFDAVLYTHDHADHVHGIDDLRIVRRHTARNIDVYAAPDSLGRIIKRFGYLFVGYGGLDGFYRPICIPHQIEGPFRVGELDIVPFDQDHGTCRSTGFRFGPFAYSTDVVALSDDALATLEGIDTWIVDCLRASEPHPTHANLEITMGWIERVKPRHAVLTHMNHQADYEAMRKLLPPGVEPGYDGMVLEISEDHGTEQSSR
jgi:phosphoribosyl 1,2-cyclic phosphate phosphodiesterase